MAIVCIILLLMQSDSKLMINTKQFEGLRLHVYTDSVGKATIGYGHNLDGGNSSNLERLGLDRIALRNGTIDLTQEEADDLFTLDMDDAIAAVKTLVPDYDSLPTDAQAVLNDLSFNMGIRTLSGFHNTLESINNRDWQAAARGLENSRWYSQVGNRGRIIVQTLRDLDG